MTGWPRFRDAFARRARREFTSPANCSRRPQKRHRQATHAKGHLVSCAKLLLPAIRLNFLKISRLPSFIKNGRPDVFSGVQKYRLATQCPARDRYGPDRTECYETNSLHRFAV